MSRVTIYNGWACKALRRDLMPLAMIIGDDDPVAPVRPRPASQPPLIDLSEATKSQRTTLMKLPPGVVPRVMRRGHAGTPGRGPRGESCGTCLHVVTRRTAAKTFPKCLLTRARWTGGAGSDVRRKDPACEQWKGKSNGVDKN